MGDRALGRRAVRCVCGARNALPRRTRASHPRGNEHTRSGSGRETEGSDVFPGAPRSLAGTDRRWLRRAHRRRDRRIDRRAGVVVGIGGHRHRAPRTDCRVPWRHRPCLAQVRRSVRPRDSPDHPGGFRQRLRGDVTRGGASARRPPLWRSARHVGNAGGQIGHPADGDVQAHWRKPAAGAERAAGAGRRGLPTGQDRRLRRLHGGEDPPV